MITFSSLPDPVSRRLLQAATRWSFPMSELVLGDDSAQRHIRQLDECDATTLVGVGVAATFLLAAAGRAERTHKRSVLALFPFLGFDAPPHGCTGRSTQWGEVLLRLAATRIGRRVLSHVSVSAEPLGLQGIYPPGSVSWSHAAGCMVSADFVSLVVPPAVPVTVVLNRLDPALDEPSSKVLLGALNSQLSLGFAHPRANDLADCVHDWIAEGQWRSGSEVLHV